MTDSKSVSLDDKYEQHSGTILINGVQALVRLPLLQKELDRLAGLDTAGYISGYRGSPLGNYDASLWREKARLEAADIVFQPGVNEDLAATAVCGTQQLEAAPSPKYDGVFAIWYGKGPGVDRSGDALKHGNYAGSHKNGGVLVVCGDDHPGKSSTIAHQSEQALAANQIPVLYPSSVREFVEFGLLGWALSRYSGLWVGFKAVNETLEQTATVDVDLESFGIQLPDRADIGEDVNYQPGFRMPQFVEIDVRRKRLPLVERFLRANRIDKVHFGHEAGLGVVCAGKSFQDVLQALSLLGVDRARAAALGLDIYKVGCIWPLESQGLRAFAAGKSELLFVEEKAAFLEQQAASILYNSNLHPRITGKTDERGAPLLPSDIQLNPIEIALLISARLERLQKADAELSEAVSGIRETVACAAQVGAAAAGPTRLPYFCSGCPHNISTRIPEGSMAMAGIGCHGIASYSRRDTLYPVHMGGEGMNWAGMEHFTNTRHVFQNLGDGTYFHSGLLAIRAAVAAGTNITYKILYNDAVAMTGGQPIDGPISVVQIVHQVLNEGVVRCVLVTDSPSTYKRGSGLPSGVTVHQRDELDAVQRALRDTSGCTVLIYEQTCAAVKRRRRKRGQLPNPTKHLFIHEDICEGCGDCSVQSTCVSLLPESTAMGTKRRIDQSSCNKDYSCVKGLCPSFVTVLNTRPRKPQETELDERLFDALPEPEVARITADNYGIMIAGIGGTGVITVGALLGMAAHLDGKACSIFDMTGLSQKNGAVYSHLRIAVIPEGISSVRIGAGEADLLLGFDLVAALSGDAASTLAAGRTRVVGNANVTPTIMFQFDPDNKPDSQTLQQQLEKRADEASCDFVDATGVALKLLGDTIGANMFMVGYAAQRGLLPVSLESITKAIEMNAVAVALNLKALGMGRLCAAAPEKLQALLPSSARKFDAPSRSIDHLIDEYAEHLALYQDQAYAQRYRDQLARVCAADGGDYRLTRVVAQQYARILAYKDEYEVARLYSNPSFVERLRDEFEDGFELRFNLSPPLLAKKNTASGRPQKREYGSWVMPVFKLLSKMKGLRGTPLDIFGYSEERRRERQLIRHYERLLQTLLTKLQARNYQQCVELAGLAAKIRGFGPVKAQNIDVVKGLEKQLIAALDRELPDAVSSAQVAG